MDPVFRVGIASASDCPCSLVAECQVNMQVPGAQSSQMATSLDADLRLSDGASLMHGRVPAEVQNTRWRLLGSPVLQTPWCDWYISVLNGGCLTRSLDPSDVRRPRIQWVLNVHSSWGECSYCCLVRGSCREGGDAVRMSIDIYLILGLGPHISTSISLHIPINILFL